MIIPVLIHGAGATTTSFNYIKRELNFKKTIDLEYDSSDGFFHNLVIMNEELSKVNNNFFIIAHSLGGIYAAHLTLTQPIIGAVTISTPYGGSYTADYMKLVFPASRLLKDISTKSPPILTARNIKLPNHWNQIVTTIGNIPGIPSRHDCVVTYESMTANPNMKFIELPYNHYEIMVAQETVSVIHKTALDILQN